MENISFFGNNPYNSSLNNNVNSSMSNRVYEQGLKGTTDEKDGNKECQTCKNRKYVDGSNEGNVSFKAPGHISPESSVAKVSAHEQQHVSNARAEGSKENKELVSANVTIKMARCPECGRTYAAGGETSTVIRTSMPNYNESNPYDRRQKAVDEERLAGQKIQAEL